MDERLRVYLGVDPGFSGGVAVLFGDRAVAVPTPEAPADLWAWVDGLDRTDLHAAVERQVPRPTRLQDGQSILRSTCLLYGHFQMLKAFLVAAGISHEEVDPQRWQRGLGFPPGEAPAKHKRRMKERAQALFPKVRVTFGTADALLIAHWLRLKHEGKLNEKEPR